MLARSMRALRKAMPKRLRRHIYRVGAFFGATHDEPFPSVWSTLTYLKKWGFQPRVVIDVGAYHGEWTSIFKNMFPSAEVLMIEPQQSKRDMLNGVCKIFAPSVAFECALLGPVDGQPLEFIEMETGSSVLEEQSAYPRSRVLKHTTTLDTLVAARKLGRVDFIKLDVQGYELEVLKGASSCLGTSELVLLEASLIPTNKGCPLIADVMSFMDRAGFRLLDFCSQSRRKDGALWQTDLIFIRESSALIPRAQLDSTNWS